MGTVKIPYYTHSAHSTTVVEEDSTGAMVEKTVVEQKPNEYTVSGHILASYYCDLSPQVSAMIK